jgi:hypothetical protein
MIRLANALSLVLACGRLGGGAASALGQASHILERLSS